MPAKDLTGPGLAPCQPLVFVVVDTWLTVRFQIATVASIIIKDTFRGYLECLPQKRDKTGA